MVKRFQPPLLGGGSPIISFDWLLSVSPLTSWSLLFPSAVVEFTSRLWIFSSLCFHRHLLLFIFPSLPFSLFCMQWRLLHGILLLHLPVYQPGCWLGMRAFGRGRRWRREFAFGLLLGCHCPAVCASPVMPQQAALSSNNNTHC